MGGMAEWGREQFAGSFSIEGCDPEKQEAVINEKAFDGGFWSVERITHRMKNGSPALKQHLAFVSVPDEGIAVLFDHAVAVSNIRVNSQEGLKFRLPNDIWNDGKQEIAGPKGKITLWGSDNTTKAPVDGGTYILSVPWISMDGKLSFIALSSNSPFTARDSLEGDFLDLPYITEPHDFHTDGLVRYSVVVLAAGGKRTAGNISKHSKLVSSGNPNVKCALVSPDGKRKWMVSVNLSAIPAAVKIDSDGHIASFDIGPMSADIRCLK